MSQSAKLTTGPTPKASSFYAGPVALSRPLARLASEYLYKRKLRKILGKVALTFTSNFILFLLIVAPYGKICKAVSMFSYELR